MRVVGYRNYLLGLLTLILAFNFVDRLALGIVLQDIQHDLRLSDTELGALSGLAFAFFYAAMGIPLGRWADRGNRITIIALTTALWSVGVALCGAVGSFLQLLLVRIGVGVGEAGCMPTGQSLIADAFARQERARATSVYMLGAPISIVVGYFAAGWLNELVGWRAMFVILATPGLILVPLVLLTLKEPRREAFARIGSQRVSLGFIPALKALWSNQTFRYLVVANSLLQLFNSGLLQWQPAFFMRSHGMTSGELGTWLAIVFGGGLFLGTCMGGELANRFAAADERRQMTFVGVGYLSMGVAKGLAFLAPTSQLALFFMFVAMLFGGMANGPLFSVLQTLVPSNLRATAVAVTALFANLIGMGLGPLLAGVLSDLFKSWAGDESLRYALLVLCSGFLVCGVFIALARRTIMRDLAADTVQHSP